MARLKIAHVFDKNIRTAPRHSMKRPGNPHLFSELPVNGRALSLRTDPAQPPHECLLTGAQL